MESKGIASSVIVAVGIAGGLGLLGSQLADGIDAFVSRDRVVTVKGLATQTVRADEVLWPISFRVLGDDLQQVYRTAETQTDIVKDFLKKGGIKAEEITDASPKVDDAQATMYGENKRTYRYILTPSVTVSTKNVDAVLALQRSMSELIAKGVTPTEDYSFRTIFNYTVTPTEDYSFRTIFNYTKLNSIKPAMIEAATVNAREAAEKFAKDSGSTLGKIRRASQGQFQIFDRDANTRWIKNVRVVTTVEYYLKD